MVLFMFRRCDHKDIFIYGLVMNFHVFHLGKGQHDRICVSYLSSRVNHVFSYGIKNNDM
jgi:hypothetical protein